MVMRAINAVPAFAVPIGESRLQDCVKLNQELEELFLARATDEYRNPTPSHLPQSELFESRFNLFLWPERCIQQLRVFVLDTIGRFVLQVSTIKPRDLELLKMQNHTWFHIARYGGSFVAHNHPLATWSAVYCVRPGEQALDQPGSGLLRLFDTRPGAGAFRDPTTSSLHAAFAVGPRVYQLEAGQIIIFPSYLFHEVSPFYGRDRRITVATNCWMSAQF